MAAHTKKSQNKLIFTMCSGASHALDYMQSVIPSSDRTSSFLPWSLPEAYATLQVRCKRLEDATAYVEKAMRVPRLGGNEKNHPALGHMGTLADLSEGYYSKVLKLAFAEDGYSLHPATALIQRACHSTNIRDINHDSALPDDRFAQVTKAGGELSTGDYDFTNISIQVELEGNAEKISKRVKNSHAYALQRFCSVRDYLDSLHKKFGDLHCLKFDLYAVAEWHEDGSVPCRFFEKQKNLLNKIRQYPIFQRTCCGYIRKINWLPTIGWSATYFFLFEASHFDPKMVRTVIGRPSLTFDPDNLAGQFEDVLLKLWHSPVDKGTYLRNCSESSISPIARKGCGRIQKGYRNYQDLLETIARMCASEVYFQPVIGRKGKAIRSIETGRLTTASRSKPKSGRG